MRRKRRRSSRVVARELKKQKVADVSYSTLQRTMHMSRLARIQSSVKPRDCLKLTSVVDCGVAKANTKKDWNSVVFSDERTFKQFKGGNPRHNFVWAKCCE